MCYERSLQLNWKNAIFTYLRVPAYPENAFMAGEGSDSDCNEDVSVVEVKDFSIRARLNNPGVTSRPSDSSCFLTSTYQGFKLLEICHNFQVHIYVGNAPQQTSSNFTEGCAYSLVIHTRSW